MRGRAAALYCLGAALLTAGMLAASALLFHGDLSPESLRSAAFAPLLLLCATLVARILTALHPGNDRKVYGCMKRHAPLIVRELPEYRPAVTPGFGLAVNALCAAALAAFMLLPAA